MELSLLVANALPIICIVCATVLALRTREGWGWMVILAFITAAVPKAPNNASISVPHVVTPDQPSAVTP